MIRVYLEGFLAFLLEIPLGELEAVEDILLPLVDGTQRISGWELATELARSPEGLLE